MFSLSFAYFFLLHLSVQEIIHMEKKKGRMAKFHDNILMFRECMFLCTTVLVILAGTTICVFCQVAYM